MSDQTHSDTQRRAPNDLRKDMRTHLQNVDDILFTCDSEEENISHSNLGTTSRVVVGEKILSKMAENS